MSNRIVAQLLLVKETPRDEGRRVATGSGVRTNIYDSDRRGVRFLVPNSSSVTIRGTIGGRP